MGIPGGIDILVCVVRTFDAEAGVGAMWAEFVEVAAGVASN